MILRLAGKWMTDKWSKLFPDASRNRVEYLIDGTKAFASIVEAIETAKTNEHYIYILGWMIDIDFPLIPGNAFKTLYQILSIAAAKGVEIRILIWNNPSTNEQKVILDNIPRLGKLSNTVALIDDNTYATAETQKFISQFVPFILQKFNSYRNIFKDFDPLFAILRFCYTKNVGSQHEKVIIVKGEKGLIGFCGGVDINKNRFPVFNKDFTCYHDTHCKVQGMAAFQLLEKFKKRWSNHPVATRYTLRGNNESKPSTLISGDYHLAKVVGTYNSPDGSDRDRSLKEAYLAIIANAEKYIYIEDQYLVNLDVARALNKKIKESNFSKMIFAIQDSKETTDILIPDRKRGEFWYTVIDGTSKSEQEKALLVLIDAKGAAKENYHAGMHSKLLIVDDEIAIIGTANVNQRSFTHDSESSIIIFDEESTVKIPFAKQLRTDIWKEFASKVTVSSGTIDSWEQFANILANKSGKSLMLIPYINSIEDLDKRVIDYIKRNQIDVIAPIVTNYVVGDNTNLAVALGNVSTVLSPFTITQTFDSLWENVIDPTVK